MKVLIDTNFFMIPFKFKLDIFEGFKSLLNEAYELYTLSGVIDELKKIAPKKMDLFNKMIEKNKVRILKSEGKVDNFIAENLKGFVVATNDKALRKKLKEKGIRLILMRQKSKLEFA